MTAPPRYAVRPGAPGDTRALGRLHAAEIDQGFLSALGPGFLARLYRHVVASPGGFVFVATVDGETAGFVAGTVDRGVLLRSFALRRGWWAAALAAPRLLRSWRRALETARYTREGGRAGEGSGRPAAELLALAVAPQHRGRGIGATLVDALQAELRRRHVDAVGVLVGAGNVAAKATYASAGFRPFATVEVHPGVPSEVLVWP